MAGDARDDIMAATFDALCEHGYANLTMQAIADEFDKSKSLLHYHYDSKDELLTAFMESLFESFVHEIEGCGESGPADGPGAGEGGVDPADRLRAIADLVVTGTGDSRDFHTALLELRAQAPHNEALRAQLVRNDRRVRELIAAVVRDGQARGQFDDSVDPEAFAALFRSTIEGAQSHDVILGDDAPTETVLSAVDDLLVDRLLLEAEVPE